MHQTSWVGLIDTMILESTGGRDAVESLLRYLGLLPYGEGQNQLGHLCSASLDSEKPGEAPFAIQLSPTKVVSLYPSNANVTDEVNLFAHLAGTAISAARQRETLRSDAVVDQLTGLLNRRGWEDHTTGMIRLKGVIAFLDIDQFKAVNQDLGYRGADEKLASIGRFLGAAFRSTDCVCRWGGDEFLALFQNMDSKTAAKRLDMVLTKIRSRVGVSISYGLVEVDSVEVDGELVAAIEAAERSIAKRAVTAV